MLAQSIPVLSHVVFIRLLLALYHKNISFLRKLFLMLSLKCKIESTPSYFWFQKTCCIITADICLHADSNPLHRGDRNRDSDGCLVWYSSQSATISNYTLDNVRNCAKITISPGTIYLHLNEHCAQLWTDSNRLADAYVAIHHWNITIHCAKLLLRCLFRSH